MKWASAISDANNDEQAVAEVVAEIARSFGGTPDLVLMFASGFFGHSYDRVGQGVDAAFPNALVVGCSGGGIIGDGRELEDVPALALIVASLPGVDVRVEHVTEVPESLSLGFSQDADPSFIVLADPFTADVSSLLGALDAAHPGAAKVGGLVSGGEYPGTNGLFWNDKVLREGALVLGMAGNVKVETIVAQGCRPVGAPMLITRCDGNLLYELQSKPALAAMRDVYQSLSPEEQRLFGEAVFVGIEMRDQVEYEQGDFLVRNIVGVDPEAGALAVGAEPRQWQAMQFHVRDAAASRTALERMLARYSGSQAQAALLFSCVGRGYDLYGEADHDSKRFRAKLGEVPMGGFFCNGEIGPVGGTTFLHGYTSSFAVFTAKE